MNLILNEFQREVQDLASTLQEEKSYFQKYSNQKDEFQLIQQEEQDLMKIKKEMDSRAEMLSKLRAKENSFILDHPCFPKKKATELYCPSSVFEEQKEVNQQSWAKPNHEIKIEILISSICPILKKWGNIKNELSFDCLRFHLHHIDKSCTSQLMHYDPFYNLFHVSHLVSGKIIRSDRTVSMNINHRINLQNQILYKQMLSSQPITLVAETIYGAILGFSEIFLDSLASPGRLARHQQVSLPFKKRIIENQYFSFCPPVFIANAQIRIDSFPVASQVSELIRNSMLSAQLRPNSRSPSPNRVVSVSPKERENSARKKNQLLRNVVRGVDRSVILTVYEGREYKFQVNSLSPTVSRELVYKQLINIKSKKVELVKIENNFFLKLIIFRQSSSQLSRLLFNFNGIQYDVNIIDNTFFQIFEFDDYCKWLKNDNRDGKFTFEGKIIHFGFDHHIFANEKNVIIKSLARQEVEDALLATIFLKSAKAGCQIYCNKPFTISAIVHRPDGYFITYYYQDQPVLQSVTTLLLFYIRDTKEQINQIQIFDCLIKERKVTLQTLVKEISVNKEEQFVRFSMNLIANQSYEYQIRSADESNVIVVNGSNFKFQPGFNEDLIIQIVSEHSRTETDLIAYDNKGRSFFIRLILQRCQDRFVI